MGNASVLLNTTGETETAGSVAPSQAREAMTPSKAPGTGTSSAAGATTPSGAAQAKMSSGAAEGRRPADGRWEPRLLLWRFGSRPVRRGQRPHDGVREAKASAIIVRGGSRIAYPFSMMRPRTRATSARTRDACRPRRESSLPTSTCSPQGRLRRATWPVRKEPPRHPWSG